LKKALFLCTHNSARSQMAEGLLRHFSRGRFDVYSAGSEATLVRPQAIRVMNEFAIDIRNQESKTLDRYINKHFDYVITVCDEANETCPVFPNAEKRLHWSIPDPSKATGTEVEQLAAYRKVRDQLLKKIESELLG
jgi:arsenate reductase